jgi:hypothetical protein
MKRLLLILPLAFLLMGANNETVDTLPPNSGSFFSTLTTFLGQEIPAIFGRYVPLGWIRSGGTHATAATCTSLAFSTEGFTETGNRFQAAKDGSGGTKAIDYNAIGANCANPGSAVCWVVGSAITADTTGNFHRSGTSNYFVNCTDATFVKPTNSAAMMKVTITNGAIAAVADIRQLNPIVNALGVLDVRSVATSGAGTLGSPWAGWESSIDCNKHIFFAPGYFLQTTGIVCTGSGVHVEGALGVISTITYNPAGSGTTAWTIGQVGTESFSNTFRNLRILSSDTTHTKTALKLIDVSSTLIENITINGSDGCCRWTQAGDGAIGIDIRGRETTTLRNIAINADQPLLLDGSPNEANRNLDHFHFQDMYLIGQVNAEVDAHYWPLIAANTLIYMTNVTFDGVQAWVGGTQGFGWVGTSPNSSLALSFSNIRWEQNATTSGNGYMISININSAIYPNLQGLTVKNSYTGGPATQNGILLRGVIGTFLENYRYNDATLTALNVDLTAYPVTLVNNWFQSGAVITLGGLCTTFQNPSYSAEGGPLQGQAITVYDKPGDFAVVGCPNVYGSLISFTPTVQGSGAAGVNTYTRQFGRFTQYGKRVSGSLDVVVNVVDGAMAGNVGITCPSCPIAQNTTGFIQSATCGVMNNVSHSAAGFTQFEAYIGPGDTQISLRETGSAQTDTALQAAAIHNGSEIACSFDYIAK